MRDLPPPTTIDPTSWLVYADSREDACDPDGAAYSRCVAAGLTVCDRLVLVGDVPPTSAIWAGPGEGQMTLEGVGGRLTTTARNVSLEVINVQPMLPHYAIDPDVLSPRWLMPSTARGHFGVTHADSCLAVPADFPGLPASLVTAFFRRIAWVAIRRMEQSGSMAARVEAGTAKRWIRRQR